MVNDCQTVKSGASIMSLSRIIPVTKFARSAHVPYALNDTSVWKPRLQAGAVLSAATGSLITFCCSVYNADEKSGFMDNMMDISTKTSKGLVFWTIYGYLWPITVPCTIMSLACYASKNFPKAYGSHI